MSCCEAIKVEKSDVTNPGSVEITNRLARTLHDLCEHMTVKEVAEYYNLHWETVKKAHERQLNKEFGDDDLYHSGYLAVDEFTFGKYHKYLTVVIDFNTGRVLWLGKDRETDTMRDFFSSMT